MLMKKLMKRISGSNRRKAVVMWMCKELELLSIYPLAKISRQGPLPGEHHVTLLGRGPRLFVKNCESGYA